MFVRRLFVLFILQIVWQDDAGHRALSLRDAESAVDEMPDLPGGHRRLHKFRGNIFEEALQIDFLLIRTAHRQARRLSDDRYDRLMIELRVIEAIEKVNRSGTGSGHAHSDFSRELRVRARHERGHFFVAHLDEFDLAVDTIQRAENAIDAVTGITVDAVHAPINKALH